MLTMAISITIFGFSFGCSQDYKIYYRFLVIELISQCIDISWFFQGLEEFKKTIIRNSIVKIIFVACIFIFVKSPADLGKYVFIIASANFLGNLSLWFYIPKYVKKINFKNLNVFKHLKPTLILFIPQIAIQIYTVLDKTMIGKMVEDKSEVGFYEQAQKVVKILLTFVTSLGTVMVPRMANTFAKGDNEQLKKYMYYSFKFVYFLSFPIMVGLVFVSKEFVPIFFGEGYDKVVILISVIVPIVLFIGLSNLIGTQYLLPIKKQKEFTISVIAGACINFILNLLLIREFKSIGASIATVIAEFSVTAIQFYFIRKEIEILKVLKFSIKNIVASILMGVSIYFIGFIPISALYIILLKIIIGFIIYIAVLFLLKDDFLKYVFAKVNEKRITIIKKLKRIS